VTYRHVVLEHTGAPEVMHVEEDELPDPGAGQARVKILAADVSFSDVNMRRGRYPGAPKPPFTPGYAMVGMVDQLGSQTSPEAQIPPPAVGQVVAALTFYGSYSQYLCLPIHDLVPVPAAVDPAEAVCMVLNYVAAYQMLQRVAHVARGGRILVHGAAGGVGTAFLELGHLAGLVMYGTASKPKHRLVTRLGATPIDYQSEDFVARIAALTGGAGVDAAFDPMGAAHLQQSARAVRIGGTVVGYGFYTAANRGHSIVLDVLLQYLRLLLWSLPPQRKHTAFYDIRPLQKKHPDWFRQDLTTLFDLLGEGKLHPVIAVRLPLDEVVHAHELVEHAEVEGKVVLIPNP
jgi:NADPH:quinone reductase-like Zn-dependent oxidoreductase